MRSWAVEGACVAIFVAFSICCVDGRGCPGMIILVQGFVLSVSLIVDSDVERLIFFYFY